MFLFHRRSREAPTTRLLLAVDGWSGKERPGSLPQWRKPHDFPPPENTEASFPIEALRKLHNDLKILRFVSLEHSSTSSPFISLLPFPFFHFLNPSSVSLHPTVYSILIATFTHTQNGNPKTRIHHLPPLPLQDWCCSHVSPFGPNDFPDSSSTLTDKLAAPRRIPMTLSLPWPSVHHSPRERREVSKTPASITLSTRS